MTNKERQARLDKKKWLDSEICGSDQSGIMDYCEYCQMSESMDCYCLATQREREGQCLCAKAYNKMRRSGK